MPKLIYEFNELLDSSYKTFSSCCCTLLSALKGRIFSIPFPRNYSRCVVINVVRPYCRTAVLIGRHSCNGTIVPVTCFPALIFLMTNYVTITTLNCCLVNVVPLPADHCCQLLPCQCCALHHLDQRFLRRFLWRTDDLEPSMIGVAL